jgi:hypothetical protein
MSVKNGYTAINNIIWMTIFRILKPQNFPRMSTWSQALKALMITGEIIAVSQRERLRERTDTKNKGPGNPCETHCG